MNNVSREVLGALVDKWLDLADLYESQQPVTCVDLRQCATDIAAAIASAPPVDVQDVEGVRCEARFNEDGSLDEVVGFGEFHLEQMDTGHWWLQTGPHMVNLHAKGRIKANFGANEMYMPKAKPQPTHSPIGYLTTQGARMLSEGHNQRIYPKPFDLNNVPVYATTNPPEISSKLVVGGDGLPDAGWRDSRAALGGHRREVRDPA